jgi:hypothetical protein
VSYARSEFQFTKIKLTGQNVQYRVPDVGRTYKEITVEFWFRPADKNANWQNRVLFTIMRNGIPFMSITKQSGGILKCLPFQNQYGDNSKYTLEYSDFKLNNDDDEIWHHISCTIDQKEKIIRGTLYRQGHQEVGYVKDASKFISLFNIY